MTSDKSTVIPRPVTKRQFSSPASCGIAHINLSDVVAKINSSGPKSCTNPFRNGLLSHSADDNSNRIDFNETLNPYSGERYLYAQVIDEKTQMKNPFRRQPHESTSADQPFFLFPSNGNINDTTSTSRASYDSGEYIETTAMLIELNEDEEQEQEAEEEGKHDKNGGSDDGDNNCNEINEENEKLLQIATSASDSSTFSSHTVSVTANSSASHNRSLSDTRAMLPNACNNFEQLKTMNPFNAAGAAAAAHNLHKTVSDTYLEKYSRQKSPPSPSQQLQQQQQRSPPSFDRTSSRQSIDNNTLSTDPANSPSTPLSVNESEMKRAMSCESINSESSVLLADLEPPQTVVYPSVTGQLCVGLQYDK